MAYREHLPHPSLRHLVECYWSIRTHLPRARTEQVLPDGCMDVLLDVADTPSTGPIGAPAAVVGSMTRPLSVTYRGVVDLWGVRFRPGGATAFLVLDASELTDDSQGLDLVWGRDVEPMHDEIACAPPEARPALLDRVLVRKLASARPSADERVLRAGRLIFESRGALPIGRVAAGVGLGARQLERCFRSHVGISPKTAARVARFRAVVDRMHAAPETSLSSLAAYGRYTDQAHMTREFRALAETTPGAYAGHLRGAPDAAGADVAFVQDGGAAAT